MMYVIGATHPELFTRVRKIVPDHFLLVPGGRTRRRPRGHFESGHERPGGFAREQFQANHLRFLWRRLRRSGKKRGNGIATGDVPIARRLSFPHLLRVN